MSVGSPVPILAINPAPNNWHSVISRLSKSNQKSKLLPCSGKSMTIRKSRSALSCPA
ncbi:Uncharacterised protein [Vibrio cholerae]|nr:Uncharacterised protein [Vibrio cholerae]